MKSIKELRVSINFSQVAFADLLGVSVASLRRWEAGDTNPSQLALERINYVMEQIEKGNLEKLLNQRKEKETKVGQEAQYRDFLFNGELHKIQYMPYVFNGPQDQLDFYNQLISMQEKESCHQIWEQYCMKLSIVQKADNTPTEQYLLEHPKENAKSWSSDPGAHGWHRYVGRFPAQLVRAICNYFDLSENDLLLDPFCGSGTTLVEARLLGIPAVGIEISPLSAMISRVKSGFNVDTSDIEEYITRLEEFYYEKYEVFLDGKDISEYSYEEIIARDGNSICAFSNYDKWFTKEALLGVSVVVEYIIKIRNNRYISELMATALSAKMRSIGNVDVDVVRAEYRKTPRENVNVLKLVVSHLKKMVKSIKEMKFSHKSTLKEADTISVIEGSCLSADIADNSVSAIITSPPYGVESLSYLRTHLLSFRSLEPLLGVDPYNFGADVIGSEYLLEANFEVESLKVMKKSPECSSFFSELLSKEDIKGMRNRVLMMAKFFEDMDELVSRFSQWLKIGGKVAFVIGNKKIGDSIIPTDKIITEIFEANGFEYITEIAHKLKTNNSNSKVPWQDRIIENEFVLFYEKRV